MVKKKNDEKSVKKNKVDLVADTIQWVVVVLLVFTSVSLVLSNFNTPLRFRVFSINSGSMSPTIKLGDLVFVRPQENYTQGDVVSYSNRRDPNQVTTHRIVQVSEDTDLERITYTTKGDANEDQDIGLTLREQLIGKVVFKLPLLGFLVSIAKTQTGFILLVVVPATILVYGELVNIKREVSGLLTDKKNKDKKPEIKTEQKSVQTKKKMTKSKVEKNEQVNK